MDLDPELSKTVMYLNEQRPDLIPDLMRPEHGYTYISFMHMDIKPMLLGRHLPHLWLYITEHILKDCKWIGYP